MKRVLEDVSKKNHLIVLLGSFLTAYAFTAAFHEPLHPDAYDTYLDYVIASAYEFLGTYDLRFLFISLLGAAFYGTLFKKIFSKTNPFKVSSSALACFFALCVLLGQSYHDTGTWNLCFGSAVNFVKFLLALGGYAFFFFCLMAFISLYLDSHRFTAPGEHFFTRHAFRKSFLILLGSYAPFILLSFPGNLCWDAIGQIDQVLGNAAFSSHHPLFHTLLMGGILKLAHSATGSYDAGLFLYILLQAVLLAASLAASIAVLAKRGAKFSLLLVIQIIYCITPVYSNVVSTALKDVPYSAMMIGYLICFSLLAENPDRIQNGRFTLCFILLQTGVILFRNNGLYVVCLTGICYFIIFVRKNHPRKRIRLFFSVFGGSVLTAELILILLSQICGAAPGSKGEMLSVPFQQTARYLQLYRQDLSQEEKAAIEAVLGDVETVAARYDPASSDPVKALFRKEASAGEIFTYFSVWLRDFFRHPAVYVEAFLVHIYGWFSPSVSNSIRYEAAYDLISQDGLFPNASKILIFYYRFLERITPISILENTGASVWALFFLTFYQKTRNGKTSCIVTLPLWISLLICMASPGFFKHPRYAFPILFTMPFLYGFELTKGEKKPPAWNGTEPEESKSEFRKQEEPENAYGKKIHSQKH